MTESEWLTCADPDAMLEFLGKAADDRALRRFACACCRRIWTLIRDERSRRAIVVAEQFIHDLASAKELQSAAAEALDAAAADGDGGQEVVAAAAAADLELNAVAAAYSAAWAKADATGDDAVAAGAIDASAYEEFTRKDFLEERSEQAALLREIVGNPFRQVAQS